MVYLKCKAHLKTILILASIVISTAQVSASTCPQVFSNHPKTIRQAMAETASKFFNHIKTVRNTAQQKKIKRQKELEERLNPKSDVELKFIELKNELLEILELGAKFSMEEGWVINDTLNGYGKAMLNKHFPIEANNKRKKAEPFLTMEKVKEVERAYAVDQFIEIVNSRELLPQGGSVHFVGSGLKFYEWISMMMLREDVKISVSELLDTKINSSHEGPFRDMEQFFFEEKMQLFLWNKIVENNPWLIEQSHIKNFDTFKSQIKNRITLMLGHKHLPLHQGRMVNNPKRFKTIPPVDLLVSMLTQSDGQLNLNTPVLKSGGTIWMSTEWMAMRSGIKLNDSYYLEFEPAVRSTRFLPAVSGVGGFGTNKLDFGSYDIGENSYFIRSRINENPETSIQNYQDAQQTNALNILNKITVKSWTEQ